MSLPASWRRRVQAKLAAARRVLAGALARPGVALAAVALLVAAGPIGFVAASAFARAAGAERLDGAFACGYVALYGVVFGLSVLSLASGLAARLRALAYQDPLTGIGNRRAFEERYALELSRADRYQLPLALLLIDVDDLKGINDSLGHLGGDRAIKLVASAIGDAIRGSDMAARIGGDELTVLCANTGPSDALVLAERIRRSVRERTAAAGVPVTVSIGASGSDAGAEPLLELADAALYEAKWSGRDRVCGADRDTTSVTRRPGAPHGSTGEFKIQVARRAAAPVPSAARATNRAEPV